MTFHLNMKLAAGHRSDFRCDNCGDAEIRQWAAQQSTAEHDILGRYVEILRWIRHLFEESERVVLQHVHALMVGAKIVDLLFEESRPEIGAEEFYHVEFV